MLQVNDRAITLLLLIHEFAAHGLGAELMLFGIRVAHAADFIDYWIMRHSNHP
jgi:hypothetical protein